jgi:glycosyltransferase involved in cell wall biosynthesis
VSFKTIIFFTKTYPFGKGEEYITAELDVLSQQFKKVILYPNDYYSDSIAHHRDLPKNVEILHLNQWLKKSNANTISDYGYLVKNTLIEFIKTDDKNYFITHLKWNLINFWTQYKLSNVLAHYLKQNNCRNSDTVFYSYWFHKSAILLSILKDRGTIQKFISRAHSVDLYHNDWGIINEFVKVPPFKMFKLKNAELIFPVSEHGTHYLKSKYPKFAKKVHTRYLGVTNMHKKKEKNQGFFHIVSCSGIDLNKRVHVLADALLNIDKQIHWTHFGSGNLTDKVREIESQFPDNIHLNLNGSTPNKTILKFYQENKVDLFVNLSIVEGLPVSILEAMAHEIPILATSVCGTPEAVIEEYNGFLLPVNFSMKELVGRLNYCIEHPEKLEKMGLNSRKLYLKKFSADKNYPEFANYLASL